MTLLRKHNPISRALRYLPLLLMTITCATSSAQEKTRIDILQAGSLEQSQAVAGAQRLIDDVIIRHKDILVYCDSAYTYENSNRVDAFGAVHINQGDTLHLYANKIFYDGDRSFARAIKNVVLKNREITLYTDTLDYDLNTNIAYYDCNGKIVDSTNTLTSKIGEYFVDDEVVHFTDSVVGFSDKYTLYSEDIRYNTRTQVIYFDGPTTIRDSANTLYAEKGWYNTVTGEANLKDHPKIYNDKQTLEASTIRYNKENGDGLALGRVVLHDIENRSIVKGNRVSYNKTEETALVTDSAVFISYNTSDSLFLHADTLRTMPDTIKGENIILAYYGVRFYRNDVQGICDSLTYYTKDSTVILSHEPVIWSDNHQISADRIELVQHSSAPDEIHMFENSFIISKQDTGMFDQIKGKNMLGYIVNGSLTSIDVDGNGQTLYYAREGENIIGMNKAESSNIRISFKDGQIHTIAFLKQPGGNLIPLDKLDQNSKYLSDFNWQIQLRPVSKDDIFRKPKTVDSESEADLPSRE